MTSCPFRLHLPSPRKLDTSFATVPRTQKADLIPRVQPRPPTIPLSMAFLFPPHTFKCISPNLLTSTQQAGTGQQHELRAGLYINFHHLLHKDTKKSCFRHQPTWTPVTTTWVMPSHLPTWTNMPTRQLLISLFLLFWTPKTGGLSLFSPHQTPTTSTSPEAL